MKKGLIITIAISVALLAIGLAYYFLIYRKQQREKSTGSNGGSGAVTGGTGGAGTGGAGTGSAGLAVGDNVYLIPGQNNIGGNLYRLDTMESIPGGSGSIAIYNYPLAVAEGTYLEGVSRFDWYLSNSIGKVLKISGDWVNLSLNEFQVWRFYTKASPYTSSSGLKYFGYSTYVNKLTGDYWTKKEWISNKPYA